MTACSEFNSRNALAERYGAVSPIPSAVLTGKRDETPEAKPKIVSAAALEALQCSTSLTGSAGGEEQLGNENIPPRYLNQSFKLIDEIIEQVQSEKYENHSKQLQMLHSLWKIKDAMSTTVRDSARYQEKLAENQHRSQTLQQKLQQQFEEIEKLKDDRDQVKDQLKSHELNSTVEVMQLKNDVKVLETQVAAKKELADAILLEKKTLEQEVIYLENKIKANGWAWLWNT